MRLALYGRDTEEEEDEEQEEEEKLPVDSLPDLLFQNAPQLLHYTAALRTRYIVKEESETQEERRGELRLENNIGTVKSINDCTDGRAWSKPNLCCRSFCKSSHNKSYREFIIYSSVCFDGSFGDDCSVTCEDCVNGACSESRDRCECSPGWTGTFCNESKNRKFLCVF